MTQIQKNVPLKAYSNFKIGGPASYFAQIKNTDDLAKLLKEWKRTHKGFPEIFILGGGTNILFPDEGIKGLVIKNSIIGISQEGNIIRVGAGTLVSDLLNYCIKNSLSGLEWAGGLPGTVGGAVRGNAGAYNGEIKDKIVEVETIDLNSLEIKKKEKARLGFDYRTSIFKKSAKNEIITYIEFKLEKGNEITIKKLIEEKINARKLRHPLEYPNLGSVFKNVRVERFTSEQMGQLSQYIKNDPFPVIPTAKLNFLAGLSGKRVGDAQVSEKHTNFIVNLGNATSKDVHALIKIIKETIKEKFNVNLEEEIMYAD
ncbi:MAG: UDP-N-acetylenolpyruvoylglucosamine reductase [Candidatus Levybacteria bacterium CG10_big_fil_rev_8_21_14_0_10_35_13]|nr:MAG: UDP-N-acetylenolpyruvoylglucosamine reductase [Candidatus Levybacteria bacterium CG10_big_fil_rev_8_21_14_0_10_35_13]